MSLMSQQGSELGRQTVDLQTVQQPTLGLVPLSHALHPATNHRLQLAELQGKPTHNQLNSCSALLALSRRLPFQAIQFFILAAAAM